MLSKSGASLSIGHRGAWLTSAWPADDGWAAGDRVGLDGKGSGCSGAACGASAGVRPYSSALLGKDLKSASKDDAYKERFGEGDNYLTVNHYLLTFHSTIHAASIQ